MSLGEFATDHGAIDGYRNARIRVFRYRYEADVAGKIALALSFAALTGLAAQIRLYLPFTPVPVTLQSGAVLLAGIVLGARWGGTSQLLYAGLGVAGVPWFAGMSAGLGTILGPTGGYVLGFPVAALLIGFLTDRYVGIRRFWPLMSVLVLGTIVIYGLGLPWLYGWLTIVQGSSPTAVEVVSMGLLPFVPGDLLTLLGVAALGTAVTPSERFGPELDEER